MRSSSSPDGWTSLWLLLLLEETVEAAAMLVALLLLLLLLLLFVLMFLLTFVLPIAGGGGLLPCPQLFLRNPEWRPSKKALLLLAPIRQVFFAHSCSSNILILLAFPAHNPLLHLLSNECHCCSGCHTEQPHAAAGLKWPLAPGSSPALVLLSSLPNNLVGFQHHHAVSVTLVPPAPDCAQQRPLSVHSSASALFSECKKT